MRTRARSGRCASCCAPSAPRRRTWPADQWQRFFETGRFDKRISDKTKDLPPRLLRAKDLVGAARLQMLRYQVVGQLESFMANRANEFRDVVMSSSVDEATRHQLLTINKIEAWFRRDPIVMKKTGVQIPDDVRHLARRIMHGVLARHRRPRLHRLNPNIDARQVTLAPAAEAGFAPLWIEIATLEELTGPEAKALRDRECQSALNRDPVSARKRDPSGAWVADPRRRSYQAAQPARFSGRLGVRRGS
jgi:hypothetical protein